MSPLANPNAAWQQTVAPPVQLPESISSANLGSTPTLSIPPTQQPAGAQGTTNSYLEALMGAGQSLDTQASSLETKSNSLVDEVLGTNTGPTETERKMQLEEQAGLGGKRKELNSALAKLKGLQAESMILPSVMQEESVGSPGTELEFAL